MNKVILIILCILLFSAIAHAEPTSNIRYLMKEETSLFDFGMYQLNKHIDDYPDFMISALYHWDDNRIKIIAFLMNDEKDLKSAKKRCRAMINAIREKLGINSISGKPYYGGSLLSGFFSHKNYKNKKQPENVDVELDNITKLYTNIPYPNKNNKSVTCQGPLVGTKILFED